MEECVLMGMIQPLCAEQTDGEKGTAEIEPKEEGHITIFQHAISLSIRQIQDKSCPTINVKRMQAG